VSLPGASLLLSRPCEFLVILPIYPANFPCISYPIFFRLFLQAFY